MAYSLLIFTNLFDSYMFDVIVQDKSIEIHIWDQFSEIFSNTLSTFYIATMFLASQLNPSLIPSFFFKLAVLKLILEGSFRSLTPILSAILSSSTFSERRSVLFKSTKNLAFDSSTSSRQALRS
jgi:hypothetical protein